MPDHEDTAARCLETIGGEITRIIERDPHRTVRPETAEQIAVHERAVLQRLGDRDGALQIDHTIGQGGTAVVRAATQTVLKRRVAVKALRADQASHEAALELLQEAWITGALEHPNVVPIHDVAFDDNGHPLIVLKHIEGVAWNELIDDPDAVRERFDADDPIAWNLDILLTVINAVRFAHSRGIVHRDLKPGNVMIGEFGEVYVLDWGIALSVRDDAPGRLQVASDTRQIAGTPAYMAPEMMGIGDVSEQTDIYLLGAILYHIMAGEPPHRGKSALEVLASVVESAPPMPEDAPPGLVQICRNAMASRPQDRFATAEALQVELRQFLKRRGALQLTARANRRLDQLLVHLAAPDPHDGWRQQLYELFGACRFGFREALSAWTDNRAARDGLHRATIAMAEHELDSGAPRAAEALLAELGPDQPDELRARISAALRARRDQALRVVELERLGTDYDTTIGARRRTLVTAMMGVGFAVGPLILQYFDSLGRATHGELLVWAGVALGFFIALFAASYEHLVKTAVNRYMAGGVLLMFLSFFPLILGTWALGVDVTTTLALALFVCFYTAACFALIADRQLLVMAAGFLAAFGVASVYPGGGLYALAGGNVVMLVNVWLMARRYRDVDREHAPAPVGLLSTPDIVERLRRLTSRGDGARR